MLIHNKIESSEVNGPGNRAVIWLQGCSLSCKGCWNPDTHVFDRIKDVHIQELVDWVTKLEINGITFSGGEPMQQAGELYILMHKIREAKPDLSFGMYSGYSLKELEEGRFKWNSRIEDKWISGTRQLWAAVKAFLDFGVLGRYNQLVRVTDNSKPLIGSLNQEVVFFTDRYSEKDLVAGYEVIIPADGNTSQVTGFPIGVEALNPG